MVSISFNNLSIQNFKWKVLLDWKVSEMPLFIENIKMVFAMIYIFMMSLKRETVSNIMNIF